jgi:hypothetical protein
VPLALAKRFDLVEPRRGWALFVHACAASIVPLVHLGGWLAVLHRYSPTQFAIQWQNRLAWFIWDVMAYVALVAVASAGSIERKLRAVHLAVERARAALLRARLASLRLRLHPEMLFRALDAVTDALSHGPEHAERTIARLGDLLRALLTTRDAELASLGDELSILEIFLDIVGPAPVHVTADVVARLEQLAVPATLTPAVAAAAHEVASVDVSLSRGQLVLCFETAASDPPLDAVRERLRAWYGVDASVRVEHGADRTRVLLFLPLAPALAVVSPNDQERAIA